MVNRAVSDQVRSGQVFYRSDQSTGISGLSAFHPSHVSKQVVDTTTLSDVLADADIDGVDFLKVVTEGHDLFRSEDHTSELQSIMRITSAVFCLTKTTVNNTD